MCRSCFRTASKPSRFTTGPRPHQHRSRSRPPVGRSGNRELLHRLLFLRSPSAASRFLYAPRAANLLREREEHIRLLEHELAQVRTWLDQTTADRNALQKQLESEQTRALQIITELNQETPSQYRVGARYRATAHREGRRARGSGPPAGSRRNHRHRAHRLGAQAGRAASGNHRAARNGPPIAMVETGPPVGARTAGQGSAHQGSPD